MNMKYRIREFLGRFYPQASFDNSYWWDCDVAAPYATLKEAKEAIDAMVHPPQETIHPYP